MLQACSQLSLPAWSMTTLSFIPSGLGMVTHDGYISAFYGFLKCLSDNYACLKIPNFRQYICFSKLEPWSIHFILSGFFFPLYETSGHTHQFSPVTTVVSQWEAPLSFSYASSLQLQWFLWEQLQRDSLFLSVCPRPCALIAQEHPGILTTQ